MAKFIEPTLLDMGFELVQVRMMGGAKPTLQVMAEPVDPATVMTVEHCARISRAISAILDVSDPIAGAYDLEVSSPGIDRPLVRARDYDRFRGFEAKLETAAPFEGRKRFRGELRGIDKDEVEIEVEGEVKRVPLALISKAKLVLTDALIAATRTQSADAGIAAGG